MAIPPNALSQAQPVEHLGALLARCRRTRGIPQNAVANELGVSPSTISKIEQNGFTPRSNTAERYIDVLRRSHIAGHPDPLPLDNPQTRLLRDLCVRAAGSSDDLSYKLAALSFEDIRSPRRSAELSALLDSLAAQPGPAYIADGLWFIHAINGAMLNLFGIAPDSPFLSTWPSWHLLAASLAQDSLVRAAFAQRDTMFPPIVALFFQVTAPYLFTWQMRALLERLHSLPHAEERKLAQWWYLATSLNLHYDLSDSTRALVRHGELVMVAPQIADVREVALNNDYTVPYMLGNWEPVGNHTTRTFAQLRAAADARAIYFATDYDRNLSFHVNTWPDVTDELPIPPITGD